MSFPKPRIRGTAIGLITILVGSLSLFGQKYSKPSPDPEPIHPIPSFPEELLLRPEPPVIEHYFAYIGYAQTSQGVLQDDPMDQDLLMTRKGWTDWRTAYNPPAGFFGFRVPTFEARIDMVVDRETYLLGAAPYDRLANPNGENALEHIKNITFEYKSSYRSYSNLIPKVSVFLNGYPVAEYYLDAVPIRNTGIIAVSSSIEKVQFSIKQSNDLQIPEFSFSRPGDYLVRVELTKPVLNPDWTYEYRRTGIAVDVYGKVVKTKMPSATLVPIYPSAASPNQREGLENEIGGRVPVIKDALQIVLPVSPAQSPRLEVSKFSADGGQFNDFDHMAQVYLRAKRFSDPNYRTDRIVAVVEWDLYNELLAKGNISSHPVFLCSAGFNWGKHFIAVPGPELNTPFTRPPSQAMEHNVIHEIFHTLSSVPWAPVDGKMADCQVAPYHEATAGGVAFGIGPGGLIGSMFAGESDIMEAGPNYNHIGQCSYRHALEILSKSEIDPPVLMVSGMATRNGISNSAGLNPLYQMDGFYELDEASSGDWHIVLKDDLGNTLGDYPFDPLFQFGGQLYESMPFNFTVPDVPGVRRVEITGPVAALGGPIQQVMDGIDYSTLPPVIWNLVADKTPGQIEVRWAAYDFDGDSLLYTLLVSEDGFTYLPTPISEASETETVFEVPDTVSHVKLVVTDGSRSVTRVLTL